MKGQAEVIIQMGEVDRIVRDHLYDETKPGGPRDSTGITVAEMLADVNAIRGKTTDAGAIRRSLRNIEQAGLTSKRNAGYGRALAYTWAKGAMIPHDYQPRPLHVAAATAKAMSPDDAAKRAKIEYEIKQKLAGMGATGSPYGYPPKTAKPAQPTAPPKKKFPPVARPSGELYMPRELAGQPDVQVMRDLRKNKLFTLIAGPPGGGKTALMEAAFGSEPGGLYSLTGDEETRVDDFVGQLYPSDKEGVYDWADGPLTLALKNGGVLFVDDATLISPKAIACLYPLMDGRDVLRLKAHQVESNGIMQPEVVHAKPGFFIVAAHNPGVQGAILSDALASRFGVHVWLETDLDLAASLGVNAKFIKLTRNLRLRRDKGEMGVFVPEMRDLLAARDFGRVFGDQAAGENLLGKAPEDFQDDLAAEMKVVFGFNITPKRLEVKGQL